MARPALSLSLRSGRHLSCPSFSLCVFAHPPSLVSLRSAGVGLGKEESYRVYSSLLALQQSKKLTFVRFFGKVLGTGADYYVAEATWETPPEPPEGEEPPPPPPGAPVEEHTTGCNTYVYFVTTDVAGEWTALPDVTPQQIVASKSIRKFLTGDLSADVRAYPPFPGKEKEYLRTQIARIVQATALEAVGTSVMPEEAEAGALPVANEAEDYVPTPTASLAAASGWCTKVYGILDVGRTVNPPPPEEELEEGEESKLPKPQPEIIPLTAISEAEWSTDVYEHGGPAVAIARSQLWPGAFSAYTCVGKLQTTASLYIGYGHPALSAPFAMLPPPPFQTEPDELVEQVDMPLEDENVAVVAAATAALAEEAANMEDPAAEE